MTFDRVGKDVAGHVLADAVTNEVLTGQGGDQLAVPASLVDLGNRHHADVSIRIARSVAFSRSPMTMDLARPVVRSTNGGSLGFCA